MPRRGTPDSDASKDAVVYGNNSAFPEAVPVTQDEEPEMQAQPGEVQSIHRIAWDELMRADAPILNHVRGAEHPVLRMPLRQCLRRPPVQQ